MPKKKVKTSGRFYVTLTLLLIIAAYFAMQNMPQKESTAVVSMATSTDKRIVDAVIIRNETVVSAEGLERADRIANEGAEVKKGDLVAYLYTTSYVAKEQAKLLSTREKIRDYQRELLNESTDAELARLDRNVTLKAAELRGVISGKTDGNMKNLEDELLEVMQIRQRYMNQNFMADTKLMQFYQDEGKRQESMSSWRSTSTASGDGIVSYYFDGFEQAVLAQDFQRVNASTLRSIFVSDSSLQTQKTKRSEQVYRIVSQDEWYIALISRDSSWAPVTGQTLSFTFDGFADIAYTGYVLGVQRSGNDVIIQLSCTDPMGPLLYQRAGKAEVGIYTTGLSVPSKALFYQNDHPGVWVSGSYGITFIPVEILSQDANTAIIQPMQTGALYQGQTILIY